MKTSNSNTVLCFDEEAWIPLEEYYRTVEEGQRPDGDYCEVRSFASKSLEQACRIAAVLQKVDEPTATGIDLDHAQSGIVVAEWFLNEIRRMTTHTEVNSKEVKAQLLLDALYESRGHQAFKKQDIYTGIGRRKELSINARQSDALLRLLEDLGYIIPNGAEYHVAEQYGGLHTA